MNPAPYTLTLVELLRLKGLGPEGCKVEALGFIQ